MVWKWLKGCAEVGRQNSDEMLITAKVIAPKRGPPLRQLANA